MTPIQIGNRLIGPGYPVYLVAEMSANHNGDLQRARALIRAARAAGADAIKIQTYTADTLTLNLSSTLFTIRGGTPWDGNTLYELYRAAATPWEWHHDLAQEAATQGLDLFSSPFDISAVDFLEAQGVPAYKVASFELVDLPLLRRIAATGKPLIISTGMASLSEIDEAVNTARNAGAREIVLLKCTSAYPAPPAEMNLRTIPHLAATFNTPVGLSDHTLDNTVAITAVAMGACLIEKHFTLARADGGPDAAFSLEPAEFSTLADAVRVAEQALGTVNYTLTAAEERNRIFRRSLFVTQEIRAGERFNSENVRSIRPGYGLHPRHFEKILGRRAACAITPGTPLDWTLIDRMTVAAIIQARLGSTRLPRKVLADLHGQPMLQRIVERVKLAQRIQLPIIATTTEHSDDDLEDYARELGIACHRGPTDDLALRLCGAANSINADLMVRIWGDCPCVDPAIIDEALDILIRDNLDYVNNSIVAGRTYPYGLDIEVYRVTVLEQLCATTDDPFYREFPFEWIMAQGNKLRRANLRLSDDWSRYHLTVDYPEDLALVRALYQDLYRPGIAFSWREAVTWLNQHPELMQRVDHLTRNPEYQQKINARVNK